ncbi:hypothetical protein DDB_G0291508 [Dictyostelium discoideum AX4]|uniref:Putative uncharacterized protein DDB_G0291508 n=1 Tax=Dictyostelium discoideum TaxID=44689 RepID=Y3943_DICDI|nr:hypothetical protein DDB_G0291508 [Dictyostelium discoideum AX4]Q54EH4.1 RecName: Full=Putative uncharacterized protein DDB_G0291508; Flags: Precursor [Dictyostelium discoideum]EAL61738.1 hypothetical protein DDB_G0291508 [Dictyostelium discoideum AX4]|eukprot:XP_635266.1 hypothetical protein DDB_G0291508 [Dictyostelium discoideum AX4]
MVFLLFLSFVLSSIFLVPLVYMLNKVFLFNRNRVVNYDSIRKLALTRME